MDAGMRIRHIPRGGFTLVEVLVTILIGLLVMVGLHQMFVGSLKAETTTSLQTDLDRAAQVAMDDILYWLRGTGPCPLLEDPTNYGIREGLADHIYFTDQTGANTLRYWLASGKLYRAFNASKYTGGTVLASDVSRLVFGYQDKQGQPALPSDAKIVTIQIEIKRSSHSALLSSSVRLRNK